MKRLLISALCCILLAVPALSSAEGAPLSVEDVDRIVSNSHVTVQDYIEDFQPTEYSWYVEGDGSKDTVFTFGLLGGSITLRVSGAKDYQDDEKGLVGTTQLEGDVLALPATLIGAYWSGPEFDKLPLPRGLAIGSTKEQLQSAIGGLDSYALEQDEVGEGYDEIASVTLDAPETSGGIEAFYGFDFFLMDGVLAFAQLQYFTTTE